MHTAHAVFCAVNCIHDADCGLLVKYIPQWSSFKAKPGTADADSINTGTLLGFLSATAAGSSRDPQPSRWWSPGISGGGGGGSQHDRADSAQVRVSNGNLQQDKK